ncbi:TPA: hypothetical protein HA238_06255 [Candidatus Micrarchaeota archaeon]|nr:hypothetical protein [Candidatus Micrarchaeota archaeon]
MSIDISSIKSVKSLIVPIISIILLSYIFLTSVYFTPSSLTTCWPQDIVRCKFFNVHSDDRLVLSLEAQGGNVFSSTLDSWPKIYLSKKASTSFTLLNKYPIMCRPISTDISPNTLYVELSCDKNISEQLDDFNADAIIFSWNVRVSQKSSVFNELKDQLMSLYAKDKRSCTKTGGSLVCDVTIGATTYFDR